MRYVRNVDLHYMGLTVYCKREKKQRIKRAKVMEREERR